MSYRQLTILFFAAGASLSAHAGQADPPVRSAFLSDSSRASYLARIQERLAINRRDRGPFGLTQHPARRDIVADEPDNYDFSTLIAAISISHIDGNEREFHVHARVFTEGQEFPIVHGSTRVMVRAERVWAHSVLFKNVETGETARSRPTNRKQIDWQQPPVPTPPLPDRPGSSHPLQPSDLSLAIQS